MVGSRDDLAAEICDRDVVDADELFEHILDRTDTHGPAVLIGDHHHMPLLPAHGVEHVVQGHGLVYKDGRQQKLFFQIKNFFIILLLNNVAVDMKKLKVYQRIKKLLKQEP